MTYNDASLLTCVEKSRCQPQPKCLMLTLMLTHLPICHEVHGDNVLMLTCVEEPWC
jgi:hypothetical protein